MESKVGASIKQELLHLGKNQAREKPRLVIIYHDTWLFFKVNAWVLLLVCILLDFVVDFMVWA